MGRPMKIADLAPAFREERFASRIVHSEERLRLVVFDLLPGQRVPPHRNSATVTLHVLQGCGLFGGADGEVRASAGSLLVYAPDEEHSIEAGDEPLRFLAILTPSPG